jgi:hypothetical protein
MRITLEFGLNVATPHACFIKHYDNLMGVNVRGFAVCVRVALLHIVWRV